MSPNARDMAENMYRALWSWLVCVIVTVIVSLMTKPKTDVELKGLVYGVTDIPSEGQVALIQRPLILGCCCCRGLLDRKRYFLVRRYETWRIDINLVLYRDLLACKRDIDLCFGDL